MESTEFIFGKSWLRILSNNNLHLIYEAGRFSYYPKFQVTDAQISFNIVNFQIFPISWEITVLSRGITSPPAHLIQELVDYLFIYTYIHTYNGEYLQKTLYCLWQTHRGSLPLFSYIGPSLHYILLDLLYQEYPRDRFLHQLLLASCRNPREKSTPWLTTNR